MLTLVKWWLQDLGRWIAVILGALLVLAGFIGIAVVFPPILFLYVIGMGYWIIDRVRGD